MIEIWKDVEDYEDSYQISNLGRIRSKDRYRKVCGGSQRFIKGKIIKPTKCRNGYLEASFARNQERRVFLLHRLVAKHFIPNPDNLPEVNHKDEDISNCRVDNLEWCTSKYNANYGTRTERCLKNNPQNKPVIQMMPDGTEINLYKTIADAAKMMGITDSPIIRVCKGKQKTACGYRWRYADREGIKMDYCFSVNLRHFREKKGLTQRQFAQMMNVSQPAVNDWENNKKYPCIDRLYDAARVLGVSVEDLLKNHENSVDRTVSENNLNKSVKCT